MRLLKLCVVFFKDYLRLVGLIKHSDSFIRFTLYGLNQYLIYPKTKSHIEMRLLLRIFRFCNPQRKHRKPSTNNVYCSFEVTSKRVMSTFILLVLKYR